MNDSADDGTNDSAGNKTNDSASNETEVEIIQKLKKKKHEKKLLVKRTDYKPLPLSSDRIAECKKQLEDRGKAEMEAKAVMTMKNDLEAAIYGARDALERDDVVKVSTAEQQEEVAKLCTEYEEWMYEAGATKTDYEQKLTKVQDLLGPMTERARELEARSDLPKTVKDAVDEQKKSHKQIVDKMPWVNVNKTAAALKKLSDFEEWWAKKQKQQEELPLHEAPAFTVSEVTDKISKLDKEWTKLLKTKKPREKPKQKPKKNETDNNTSSSNATELEVELPSDPATVEKELALLREQKASAVEREDFDAAHKLKQREQKLSEHLKRLNAQKSEL